MYSGQDRFFQNHQFVKMISELDIADLYSHFIVLLFDQQEQEMSITQKKQKRKMMI